MKKTVYVIGAFDLFHRGHLELLRRAKELGDRLIVAINSDDLVTDYKRKPFFSEVDRLAIVKACCFVDEAFIIRDLDNKEMVLKYSVDCIVHGDDWQGNSYLEQIRMSQNFIENNKIELIYLPYTKGISTSELIKKISMSYNLKF